jgi:hypothetical protein
VYLERSVWTLVCGLILLNSLASGVLVFLFSVFSVRFFPGLEVCLSGCFLFFLDFFLYQSYWVFFVNIFFGLYIFRGSGWVLACQAFSCGSSGSL